MNSSATAIPKHLRRNGRRIVPDFKGEELLYRRFEPADITDGKLEISAFDEGWPALSVNRGKFSKPADVRVPEIEFGQCGAAQCAKENIPLGFRVAEGKDCHLAVVHAPLDDNYAHSEIVSITESGERNEKEPDKAPVKEAKPGKVALTQLRMKLRDVFEVCLLPGAPAVVRDKRGCLLGFILLGEL